MLKYKQNSTIKRLLLLAVVSVLYTNLFALESDSSKIKAKFLYDVNFLSYFDNHEYAGSPYQGSATLFGLQLSPEIGVGVNDLNGGEHRIMAGFSYLQPIGNDFKQAKLLPIAYYNYKKEGLGLNIGMVPYNKVIETLPQYLLDESLLYIRPNLQGALFQYQTEKGFVEFLADWRGYRDIDTREAFRIVINGRYKYKSFFVGGIGQINHLANKAQPSEQEGVCDDIVISPYIGADFSQITPLDSLSIRATYLLSMQRDRKAEKTYLPQGGNIEIFLRWKYLGFSNNTYFGENLFPFYEEYGTLLNQGNPFYQSKFYNRTDLFVYLVNNSFVNCFFSFNIHITDTKQFNHQEQLIVQFKLDGIWEKNKKKKLKSVFGK